MLKRETVSFFIRAAIVDPLVAVSTSGRLVNG